MREKVGKIFILPTCKDLQIATTLYAQNHRGLTIYGKYLGHNLSTSQQQNPHRRHNNVRFPILCLHQKAPLIRYELAVLFLAL